MPERSCKSSLMEKRAHRVDERPVSSNVVFTVYPTPLARDHFFAISYN